MPDSFDAYHKWLGISPKDQPPHHYRLLGIEMFESDPDVIEAAADQRMAHVRTYQTGQNSELSQRILNELSAAKLCLLTGEKKAAYDAQLRQRAAAPAPVFNPVKAVVAPVTLPAAPAISIRTQPPRRKSRSPTAAIAGASATFVLLLAAGLWYANSAAPTQLGDASNQSRASMSQTVASRFDAKTAHSLNQPPKVATASKRVKKSK